MQKYINNVATVNGVAVVGASVAVTTLAGAPATIYANNGSIVAANPLTTDQFGNFSFYAPDGHYSLIVSGTGIFNQTVTDVLLEDAAADIALPNFSDFETPGGLVNGANATFTTAYPPNPAKSCVGWVQHGGSGAFLPMIQGVDFTLSGNVATTAAAPAPLSVLLFSYRH